MTASARVAGSADARPAHLHPNAYSELVAALEQEKRSLTVQLAALEADLQELPASSADDVAERDRAELLASLTRDSLDSVQAALDRAATGTFGRCTGCGGPIPAERLQAVPDAQHCVSCPPVRRRLG